MPGATEQAIQNFEAEFSIRLPSDYRDFLKETNGGFPDSDLFDTPGGRGFALSRLFPLGGALPFELRHQNKHRIDFTDDYVDIGMGQGGDHLGLGIRASNYGRVVGSDHELDVGEDPESAIYFVAHSFSAFVQGLYSTSRPE